MTNKEKYEKIGATSSDASTIFKSVNDKQKKFFVQTNSNTRKITNKNFVDFVVELMNMTDYEAKKMILDGYISVNGDIISDTAYQLKLEDVVRGGVGHVLVNSKFIAIVN